MHNKLYRCDPNKNKTCSKIHCYKHVKNIYDSQCLCSETFIKKYRMSIFKRIKEFFEKPVIPLGYFEHIINKLDMNKYHVNRSCIYDPRNNTFYVTKWYIYRCDMPIDEYFDPRNEAILTY